jgi:hypothetical protein
VSKKDAIRVIVGDGSRVDRDLVRFMLERDGFRVISSVAASEDLNRAASVMQPDAVVLGEELLDLGGGQAARLARGACPEAKIVLFSALPAAAAVGPGEPDAVLERGIGLKDLTRSLNDLFQPSAAGTVATLPIAAAGARASAAPAPVSPPPPPLTDEPRRRPFLILAAAAAAMVLLVFVVARNFPTDEASVRSSGVPSTAPAIGAAGAGAATATEGTGTPSPTPTAIGEAPLSGALSTLGLLTQAIRDGDLAQVPGLVRKLVAERAVAAAAGADVSRLNELIGERLAPLTQDLEPRTGWALRYNLGTLVPPPDAGGPGPSEPGPSNEEPRPDPETSPPPVDDAGETTPPPTDSGSTGPPSDGGTEGPDPDEDPYAGGGDTDNSGNDGLAEDRDPNSGSLQGDHNGSNAPPAESGSSGGDQDADDSGDEPGSDAPIASTGPSTSSGGDRETTTGGDLPDDGDGDAAADGS